MPWRLILFIIVFAVFLGFIAFNLGNTCDISFGFTSFKDVPVFFTVFSSFMLGMLCTLPVVFGRKKRKDPAKDEPKLKKKWGKKKDEPAELAPVEGGVFSDGGPYGVN
jgi:uncharacterized integral membrane protein